MFSKIKIFSGEGLISLPELQDVHESDNLFFCTRHSRDVCTILVFSFQAENAVTTEMSERGTVSDQLFPRDIVESITNGLLFIPQQPCITLR